jgi:hypothetical protein
MMRKIILIIFIILCSCQEGNQDDFVVEFDSNQYNSLVLNKIDGDYLLERSDGTDFKVKGSIIYFINKSNRKIEKISKDGEVIPSLVLDYKSNTKFGVVLQKPIDEICNLISETETPDECEELIRASKHYCYWIIIKKRNEIYGPLSLQEYKELKTKLNISKDLVLINE